MAQPNQFGKQDFQKLTYSMDPKNPDALAASKTIESMVKNAIAQLQKEGAPVMHGQRRYDAGGVRNTDYYVPGQHAAIVQNAVMAAVEQYEARMQRSSGISLSSASPATFRTQTAAIMSPQTRAEVARLVKAHGGFFNPTSNGMVNWGVDKDVRVTGAGGKEFGLASSLIARIGSSNMQHRTGFESLLYNATGKTHSYNDYNEVERPAVAQAAKSQIARRARRGITAETEREEAYARLAKSGRAYAHAQQYAADNPNDPLVAKRREALNKIRKKTRGKKIKGAGRFAMSTIGVAIASSLALLGTGVAILSKIKDAVLGIGSDIRRQNKADQTYNFAEGTTRNWERFAAKRGVKKELLGQAAGGVMSAWSSPLKFADSNFDKLAPYLGTDISDVLRMTTADGDQNVLGIMSQMMDTLARKSSSGVAGIKTGLTKNQAFTENYDMLKEHNAPLADLFASYWYDAQRNGGVGGWSVGGRKMDAMGYLTQGSWNPEFKENGSGMTNSAVQNAAEGTYNSMNSLSGAFNGLKTDVFERIFANTQQLVEDFRSLLTQWVGKYFPAFAMKEQQRAMYMNTEAEKLATANVGPEKTAAAAIMKKYGLGSIDNIGPLVRAIETGDMKNIPNIGRGGLQTLYNNPEDLVIIAQYAHTVQKLLDLATARREGNRSVEVYNESSHAAESTTKAMIMSAGLEKVARKLGAKIASKRGLTDIDNYLDSNMTDADLDKFIAKQSANLALHEGKVGDRNQVFDEFGLSESALMQMAYAYAATPGKGKELAASKARLLSFYMAHGADRGMKKTDIDKAMATLEKELEAFGGLAGVAEASLDTRGNNALTTNAATIDVESMSQVNKAAAKNNLGDISKIIGAKLLFDVSETAVAQHAGSPTNVYLIQDFIDERGVRQHKETLITTLRNSGLGMDVTVPVESPIKGLTEARNAQMRDN